MRVLLVVPESKLFNLPLGLCYLASALKAAGHEVRGVDFNIEQTTAQRLKRDEDFKWAELIGITCTSPQLSSALHTARFARGLNPKAHIIAGGPHPTLCPGDLLADPCVDMVCIGEGEHTLVELVGVLQVAPYVPFVMRKVRGLGWKRLGGDVEINAPRPWEHDLDRFPWPDRTIWKPSDYGMVAWPVLWSRSCPGRCANCMPGLRTISGPWRHRSVDDVLSELGYIKRGLECDWFSVLDNDAVANAHWFQEICAGIVAGRLDMQWDMQAKIESVGVGEALPKLMRQAGCTQVTVGIESGSQRVVSEVLHKQLNLGTVRPFLERMTEHGIHTQGYFMYGIPGETLAEMRETLEYALRLNLDRVGFSVALPLPGTLFRSVSADNGWLTTQSLLFPFDPKLGGVVPTIKSDQFTLDDVNEFKREIRRRLLRAGYAFQEDLFATNVKKQVDRKLGFVTREGWLWGVIAKRILRTHLWMLRNPRTRKLALRLAG